MLKTTQTDSVGDFYLFTPKAREDEYQLQIERSGFKNFTISSIKVDTTKNPSQIYLGEIFLEKDSGTSLTPVTVIGKKKFIEHKFNKTIVNIENSTFVQGNSLYELLPILPGIKVDPGGDITLHGKSNILFLLDGKGQVISMDQVSDMLKNISASTIEKIEIIHNPSAKYDGNVSGVINVITLKKKNISDFHVGYGSQFYTVPGSNGLDKNYNNLGTKFNTSIGKISLNANVDYTKNVAQEQSSEVLTFFTKNPTLTRYSNSLRSSEGSLVDFTVGCNYDINKNQFIDFRFNTSQHIVSKNTNFQNIAFFTANSPIADSSILSSGNLNTSNNYFNGANLKYVIQLKHPDEELALFWDFNDYNYNQGSNFQNTIFYYLPQPAQSKNEFNSNWKYYVAINSFKIDYTRTFNTKTSLDAGGKISFVQNTSDYDQNTNLNKFSYKETISAGYLNLRREEAKFSYEFGIRGEHTFSEGRVVGLTNIVSRNYLNFFPTITTQYNLNNNNNITLSYKTTIKRPTYAYFNPVSVLYTPFMYVRGDSVLNPRFSRTYQATLVHKDISLILTGDYVSNVQSSIIDSTSGIVNISSSIYAYKYLNEFSAELDFPLKFNKWYTTENNLSTYLTIAKLPNNFTKNNTSFDISSTHILKFSKSASANLIFDYSYFNQTGFSKYYPNFRMQLSITKTWRNKFSLNFNINDVFGNAKIHFIDDYGYIKDETKSLNNNRRFRITLRYKFNSGNLLSKRTRSSKDTNSELRF